MPPPQDLTVGLGFFWQPGAEPGQPLEILVLVSKGDHKQPSKGRRRRGKWGNRSWVLPGGQE